MYRKVVAWQKAMELVPEVYKMTELFPDTEKYGLVSQTRRCVVSIPSNIAEGKMRRTRKEYLHFLNIAYASGAELETQMKIIESVGFSKNNQYFERNRNLLTEVMKLLASIIDTIQTQIENGME